MTAGNGLPCKRCGTSEWYDNGGCKECKRTRARQYHAANLDKAREHNRLYEAAHPNEARERGRRWRAANREKENERTRQWKIENRERHNENNRLYKKANPDKGRANTQNRRARKSKAGGSFTANEWKSLCRQYNDHCCYPGCERTDLHADHVVPISRGGTSDISNIQPLCSYHNTSKGAKTIDYRTKPGLLRWIQKKLFS